MGGALERIERELFDADWAEAKLIHGDATTSALLARTPAQRRHDALVLMAERAMAAPVDGRRPAPLVNVIVDYPTFAGRVVELAGGTVVAPGDVAELLGRDDTLVRRVVFDGPNRIVDISSARTFRGTLRAVLDLIHQRCRHDTCDVPARLCEGDHVVAWSDGGLTTQANGQLACGFHNRWSYAHRHDPPPHDAPPELPDGPDEPSRPGDALARSPVAVASEANRPTAVAGEHSLAVLRRRTRGRLAVADAPDLRFGQGDRVCVVDLVRAVLPLDDDQWRPIAAFLPD